MTDFIVLSDSDDDEVVVVSSRPPEHEQPTPAHAPRPAPARRPPPPIAPSFERPYKAEPISLPDSEDDEEPKDVKPVDPRPFPPPASDGRAGRPLPAVLKAARKSAAGARAGTARRAPLKQKRAANRAGTRAAALSGKTAEVSRAASAQRRKRKEDLRLDQLPYPFTLHFRFVELQLDHAALPAVPIVAVTLGFRSGGQSSLAPTRSGSSQFRMPAYDVDDGGLATVAGKDLPPPTRLVAPTCPPLPDRNPAAGLVLLVEIFDAGQPGHPAVCGGSILLCSPGTSLVKTGEDRVTLKTPGADGARGKGVEVAAVGLSWDVELPVHRMKKEGEEWKSAKGVTDDQLRDILEDELRKLEQEWRDDLTERDESTCKLESTPLPRRQPFPLPRSSLPTPSSLIPDLDSGIDGEDLLDRSAFTHRWAAVPPYFHVEFASRGMPHDDGPLSAFPYIADDWEDSAAATRAVEASVDRLLRVTAPQGEEKGSEDVAEEEERLELYLDHETLAAPDIGRVERDFHALASLLEQLDLSTSFLTELECEAVNKAKASGEYGEDAEAFALQTHGDPDSLAVKALNWYEKLHGEVLIDKRSRPRPCQFCGQAFCSVHGDPYDSLAAYNFRTRPKSRPHLARIGGCPQCGRTNCVASEELTTNLSPEAQKIFEELTAQDVPPLDPCTLSLMLKEPVGESDRCCYLPHPPAPDFPVQRIKKEFAPINSSGYEPCECNGPCKDDSCTCFCNETFCDRYCGCPPECYRRFPGCDDTTCDAGCYCAEHNRECDPLLCSCVSTECNNSRVRFHQQKATQLVKSEVKGGGFGLAMRELARPDDFLGLYGGELFEPYGVPDSTRVGGPWKELLKGTTSSYYFSIEANDSHAVDSEKFGALTRYINGTRNADQANCVPRIWYVAGTHQVGLYATHHIRPGEELRMHYGTQYGEKELWAKKKATEEAVFA
ncbi:hypothetical protein JCM10213v2_004697 [Rhodosporidiobolus nylandii]